MTDQLELTGLFGLRHARQHKQAAHHPQCHGFYQGHTCRLGTCAVDRLQLLLSHRREQDVQHERSVSLEHLFTSIVTGGRSVSKFVKPTPKKQASTCTETNLTWLYKRQQGDVRPITHSSRQLQTCCTPTQTDSYWEVITWYDNDCLLTK